MTLVYAPHDDIKKGGRPWTRTERVFYGIFSRAAWGVALTWVVYACHNGLGGVWNSEGHAPPPLYDVFREAERGIYITFIEIETFSKNPLSGLIQRFLSARFWIPLSRLTYSTYLVHPIVLTFIFKSSNTALYYSPKTVVSKILYRS